MAEPFVGRSIPRFEDDRLLRGRGLFVADVHLPTMAHAAIVRSCYAHGSLRAVDLGEARAMPGVLDAFSARDIAAHLRPMPSHRPLPAVWEAFRQFPLAVDTVRYVGEPVAVVIAESRHLAEDATAAVVVEIDPLPVVDSVDTADTVPLFRGQSNILLAADKTGGMPLAQALEIADVVVEEEFHVQRHSGVPLETRGLLARPDSDGGLTVWGVAKMPHLVRAALAELVGLEEDQVRLVPVDVGGGFGVRGEFYPEDFLVPFAALRLGQPVRWIEDRTEHLLATNHARESHWRLRAGATGDGDLVLFDGEITLDIGAYVRPLVGVVAEQCALNLLGPYRVRSFGCRVTCALTNKMGIGTMRAPGRFEATFAREGLLDALAVKLGVDPRDLRERNLLRREDYPHDTGVDSFGKHVIYDSGDPLRAFQVAAAAVAKEAAASGSLSDDGCLVGTAVAPFIESTGLGPFEHARLTIDEPGQVVVRTATTSMGQGHATAFAQVAADALGIDAVEVVVIEGDPSTVGAGIGTFASRTAVMGGNAIWAAGTELRQRIEKLDPHRRLSLEEVRREAEAQGIELDVEARFESHAPTYAYGAHAAVVKVDPELGTLEIARYIVVADVGRMINPQIVMGQIKGGVALGVGGALLEEIGYSDEGQPLSGSFMDYLLPSAHDAPCVEVILLDDVCLGDNPLGVKGAGEIGTIGAGAVIAGAARAALRSRGVGITRLPLKPDRLVVLRRA